MSRATWRRTLGGGITRPTGTDGAVTVRPAHDGGTRVIVSRRERFGETLDGEPTYVYRETHSRRWSR